MLLPPLLSAYSMTIGLGFTFARNLLLVVGLPPGVVSKLEWVSKIVLVEPMAPNFGLGFSLDAIFCLEKSCKSSLPPMFVFDRSNVAVPIVAEKILD